MNDLPQNRYIKKVAILGAGVMGAQIAAHFVNAGIMAILFDLAAKDGERNALALNAIENLKKLKPAPLGDPSLLDVITPANYDDNLDLLTDCDLVIEAISERMDWKVDLYNKITPFFGKETVFATNTSGLSLNKLAEVLPKEIRPKFFGVHFFNPPRYMNLVELIPHDGTDPKLMEQLEAFIVSKLGKGAVYANDTPNFIGNRVGMFSILSVIHHAQEMNIAPDVVDLLTGPLIGRPRSATFRTLDIVGLDTFAHVVNTMTEGLPDDPWHKFYKLPQWMLDLIDKGALGQKSKGGIFKRVERDNYVFDVEKGDYRLSEKNLNPEITAILKQRDLTEKFTALKNSDLVEAKFLWACFRDLFHYSAYHLSDVANCTRDVDLALRWGYAWSIGPFELWQGTDWKTIATWIKQDIADNKAMCSKPLPEWVTTIEKQGVYHDNCSYSAVEKKFKPRSNLPVYKKQIFPDPVHGESFDQGTTIYETDAIRLWETTDNIAILSFKTKMNTINTEVLDGIQEAIRQAEPSKTGLVIWQNGNHFSLGANLQAMLDAATTSKEREVEILLEKFQQTSLALRYAKIPTVAAVRGMALGGGCELMLHCARTIAAFESNIGLVETGVGLIPAGGGCKEMALRVAKSVKDQNYLLPALQCIFANVNTAQRSTCAAIAKQLGYIREDVDTIIMNPYELLYVAKQQVLALAELGYQSPLAEKIPVVGKPGFDAITAQLAEMKSAEKISEHDYTIGHKLAKVFSGGEVDAGAKVDENEILTLERKYFMELLQMELTQARIAHTLKTGKPLKN